jgi:hypothetical protein
VGIAEWYVNYATIAAKFIPVFAIAGTLLVAGSFAWASHMHGSYLKQLAEIIHPSMEYRNVLGRNCVGYFDVFAHSSVFDRSVASIRRYCRAARFKRQLNVRYLQ